MVVKGPLGFVETVSCCVSLEVLEHEAFNRRRMGRRRQSGPESCVSLAMSMPERIGPCIIYM